MAEMIRVSSTITGTGVVGGGTSDIYFAGDASDPLTTTLAVKDMWTALASWLMTGTTVTVPALYEVVEATNGEIQSIETATGYTITGTRTGSRLPPQIQGLIQWRTGVFSDGREIRGRLFVPCLSQDSGDGLAPNSTFLTALENAGGALKDQATCTPVVYRRKRPARPQVGSPGDPWYLPAQTERSGTFAAISTAVGWSKYAVLRSRRD